MSDFTDILTHGRRLQGAVKELSLQDLEAVQEKLANIIDKRKRKEAEKQKEDEEKRSKVAEFHKQLAAAGLDVDDLRSVTSSTSPNGNLGKKRPIKYKLGDAQGNTHTWTGIGRMPKVFKEALDKGKKLQDFSI